MPCLQLVTYTQLGPSHVISPNLPPSFFPPPQLPTNQPWRSHFAPSQCPPQGIPSADVAESVAMALLLLLLLEVLIVTARLAGVAAGPAVEDGSSSRKIESLGDGAGFSASGLDEFDAVGEQGGSLEVPTASVRREVGRKLLQQQPAADVDNGNGRRENNRFSFFEPKKVAMAMPVAFVICCALLCPCFQARRKGSADILAKDPSSRDSTSTPSFGIHSTSERIPASPLRVPPSPSRFSMSPQMTRVGSIHLNMSQVNKATRNFSPVLKLGEGGFGTVYKAQLQDGQIVAIKRAKKEHFDALQTEFSSEVELLAKIEHRNLVKLLGYVDKGNDRIIITEYVSNGTLREHLDGQREKILDFNQRLEIAIDVAHGLTYLHLYTEKPIIHRDVKSSNILLTESMRAKVADFGFARLGSMEIDQTHISTKVKGTAGYLDPEYMKTYQLTPKSDVYSFGILLIEILSGRRPVEFNRSAEERITVRWAFKNYNEGNLTQIVDPLLGEEIEEGVASKMLSLAFQCAAPTRSDRPTMKEVGEQLWGIRNDRVRSLRK